MELTRLARANRDILELLATEGAPETLKAFGLKLGRDPSNLQKTLRGLEAEGWLTLGKPPKNPLAALTDAAAAVADIVTAADRLRAGLPVLTHGQIRPDPDQPRRDFDSAQALAGLAELADSLHDRGQLQPILVRMIAPDAAVIVAGERRWRAIGLLIADGRRPADQPVDYHLSSRVDEVEILVDQVVENLQRENLHELEEAQAFDILKDKGWGVGRISQAIGKTRKFVETRLDLLLLPESQRDRMRLPKGDPDRLSFSRARDMVQHMRQIEARTAEQRDIEEIAPRWTPEQEALAAAVKLTPDARRLLGEIAHAAAARPSAKFPDSPGPILELRTLDGMTRDEHFGKLTRPGKNLIDYLMNSAAPGEPCGVRVTPLGHIRLRLDNLHPADAPRNLYHLRREADVPADQARQLERDGRYRAAWLNLPADPEITPGGIRLLPHEVLAAVELADRSLLRDHLDPAHPGHLLLSDRPDMTTVAALGRAKVAVTVTAGIGQPISIALTRGGGDWLRGLGLWPGDGQAAAVLANARAAAGEDPAVGEDYATDWLNWREPTPAPAVGGQDTAPSPAGEEDREAVAGAVPPPALTRAEFFSEEVQAAALALARSQPGGERYRYAKISGTTTVEGETWPAESTERLAVPWEGYPRVEIRLTRSDRDRWFVSLSMSGAAPNFRGHSSPPHVWTSDPLFRSRADALAHAAEEIRDFFADATRDKRRLEDWISSLEASTPPSTSVPALNDAQLRILREVCFALERAGASEIFVGRYWLDLDAVEMWKADPPLIEFVAPPGQGWQVRLTDAGRVAHAALTADIDPFALELRIRRQGGYDTEWLNTGGPDPASRPGVVERIADLLLERDDVHERIDAIDIADRALTACLARKGIDFEAPDLDLESMLDEAYGDAIDLIPDAPVPTQPAQDGPDAESDDDDGAPTHDDLDDQAVVTAERLLEDVRATLARTHTAGEIRDLLGRAGLRRPFEADNQEVGVVRGLDGEDDAVIDVNRELPDPLALARAELVAYGLNLASGPVDDTRPRTLIDGFAVDRLAQAAGAIQQLLLREIDPTTPLFSKVEDLYASFSSAVNATRAEIEAAKCAPPPAEPLFALHAGDLVSIGGTASAYRLIKVDSETGLSGTVFRAQQVRLDRDKDYGQPRSITLHAIQRVVRRKEP